MPNPMYHNPWVMVVSVIVSTLWILFFLHMYRRDVARTKQIVANIKSRKILFAVIENGDESRMVLATLNVWHGECEKTGDCYNCSYRAACEQLRSALEPASAHMEGQNSDQERNSNKDCAEQPGST